MSSLTTLSYNYYLKNSYTGNRSASNAITRPGYTNNQLILADANATQKLASKLKDLEYTSDNSSNIYNSTNAFVSAYNNLIASASKSTDKSVQKSLTQIKTLTKTQKDALSDLGITIATNGSLTLSKTTFSGATASKVAAVFSDSNAYTSTLSTYARKLYQVMKKLPQTLPTSSSDTSTSTTSSSSSSSTGAASTIDVTA